MFTPNELEAMPLGLESYFKDLENRVMVDIVRRLRINGEITRAADWQIYRLYELGKSQEEIKKLIQDALNLSDKEVDALYNEVIKTGYSMNEKLYKATGKNFIPFRDNKELQQLIAAVSEQTKAELKNLTQSLGFAVRDGNTLKFTPIAEYYQKTLDNAMYDITSGTFDYNTVLRRVVSEMTNSGLRTVDYATGWSNRVDVAARRALMTGVNQVTAKINEDNAKQLDTEYFEVSWHSGARPSHQEWQGKVYTKKELETVCGLGTVTGLCGANCYHSYYPFIPGVSERTYSDKELERMNAEENAPKEFRGKEYTKYEALQRQRKLETAMRAQRQQIKLLQEGGASENDIMLARARYRVTSAEYTRFSEAMGLPQQRERVTVDGLGNIGVGKADLSHLNYNDIIFMKGKMSNSMVRKWYVTQNKKIPDLIDTTKPIEEQARQAYNMRNTNKKHARELMQDIELAKQLDIDEPYKSFDELLEDKMKRKGLTRYETLEDIIKTSAKTRKSINEKYRLE